MPGQRDIRRHITEPCLFCFMMENHGTLRKVFSRTFNFHTRKVYDFLLKKRYTCIS